MCEYEIYVPLVDNKGKGVGSGRLKSLRSLLVREFGGVTHFPQANEGIWKVGSLTFRDKIVILRVLSSKPSARSFLTRLKKSLKHQWGQTDVLIVSRKVSTL